MEFWGTTLLGTQPHTIYIYLIPQPDYKKVNTKKKIVWTQRNLIHKLKFSQYFDITPFKLLRL